jgi:hypothetical protein
MAGFLLAALALAGCGSDNTPSAATLLKNAQASFDATKTFHFVMQVQHAGQPPAGGYVVTAAQGDVERPDKVSAKADVNAGFASVSVNLVIIGNQEWYTDPLTGKYQQTDQFATFLRIFDANQGIGSLLTQLQNPSAPQESSANGTSCWKVSGTLPPQLINNLFGDSSATKSVPTSFCIGKDDSRLYSATLSGIVTAGDTDQTVRTFYLSNFDKPVSIQPPV